MYHCKRRDFFPGIAQLLCHYHVITAWKDWIKKRIKDSQVVEAVMRRMNDLMYMACPNSETDMGRFALNAFKEAIDWVRLQPG
jgi:hypothetical protein